MKILVYGAGVLGSLYAARLKEAGHEVALLARGRRLADLIQHGIILEDAFTRRRTRTIVDLVDALRPDDSYDLILVIVRKSQVAEVLPSLSANWNTPAVLFLVNNAAGPDELAAVGQDRLLIGFPGAGGTREGHVVRYLLAGRRQPTSIGEPDGRLTPRLDEIAGALRAAGFQVAIRRDMDAWLKTHVALVSPLANALYLAEGDIYRLAGDREALSLLVQAVREGFRVLRLLGVPVTPPGFRLLEWVPQKYLINLLQKRLATEQAELAIARHANAARDEMKQLAGEFQALVRESGLKTPAIDRLCEYV
jgi:2-dehydropantoate 2-reductase